MGLSCQLSSTCPSTTKAMSMHFRESKWRFRVVVAVCAIRGWAFKPVVGCVDIEPLWEAL